MNTPDVAGVAAAEARGGLCELRWTKGDRTYQRDSLISGLHDRVVYPCRDGAVSEQVRSIF
jgi:hypothetical protein